MESSTTWRQVRKLETQYSFVRLLGSGSFGTCFLMRNLSSRKLCVLKAIHGDLTDELCQEVDILMNVSKTHPNIVSYIDHFEVRALPEKMASCCKKPATHCILTEYIEGDTLHDFVKKVHSGRADVPPPFLRSLLQSSLDALVYMHEIAQIAHRDIKPGNLLVSPDGRLVFIDFGLSVVLPRRTWAPQDDSGTPNYFSPSIVLLSRSEERATKQMWFASDVWGLGASLYYLCTGHEVAKLYADRERSFDEVLAFRCPDVVYAANSDLNSIIRDMLNPNHHERPTARDLLERVLDARLLRRRAEGKCITTMPRPALRAVNSNTDSSDEQPVGKRTRHANVI
eukprot:m.243151 g.243151  ORF g.243151 m.243151 type:complete len:340 (+) comp14182_c0_seq1:114-1133(+)